MAVWLLMAALAWTALAFADRGRTLAESPGTMLVVRVAGDDAIVLRVRAELRNGEWRVIELPVHATDAHRSLDVLAKGHGANAALRARPSQLAVELWVAPVADREVAGSDEVLVAAGPRADVGVLALRVTEVLRARGLGPAHTDDRNPNPGPPTDAVAKQPIASAATSGEGQNAPVSPVATADTRSGTNPADVTQARTEVIAPVDKPATAVDVPAAPTPQPIAAAPKLDPTPTAPTIKPTPAAPEPEADGGSDDDDDDLGTPAQRALVSIELAPALVQSPGGLGPSFDAFGDVRVQPFEHLSFSVFALGPLLRSSVHATVGSAEVRTLAIGGTADLQLPLAAWELSAGAGAAALLTWVQGSLPSTGYSARDSSLRTAAVLARVGVSLRLTDRIRLSSRVLLGVALPTPIHVKIPMTPEVSWGLPFVVGAIGIEVALPWER